MKDKKNTTRQTTIKVVLIACACALALVYFAGVIFFFTHFMPNTMFGTRNVSMRSASDVAAGIESRNVNYSLNIHGDDFNLSLNTADVNLLLDAKESTQAAIAQSNPWIWPYAITQSREFAEEQNGAFDEQKVDELICDALSTYNKGATQPINATITYNANTGTFVAVPAQKGTTFDPQLVAQATKQALDNMDNELILDTSFYQAPTRETDDPSIALAIQNANALVASLPSLNLNGTTYQTLKKATVGNWVDLADDGSLVIDTDAVQEWVAKTVEPQLTTVGNARTYTRPDGKVVTVKGGTYGWKVDTSSLAAQIVDAIENKTGEAIEIPVKQKADQMPDDGGKDFSDTYIDIDLSEQHARYFVDGEQVWESDLVSGNPNQSHATPEGIYTINANFHKDKPASTLVGKYDPATGQPEYRSEVKYWMPFIGNTIGLHDASWRSTFGKTIYLSNGSHGCINLPVDKAGELCELIDQGTVVIVHQ